VSLWVPAVIFDVCLPVHFSVGVRCAAVLRVLRWSRYPSRLSLSLYGSWCGWDDGDDEWRFWLSGWGWAGSLRSEVSAIVGSGSVLERFLLDCGRVAGRYPPERVSRLWRFVSSGLGGRGFVVALGGVVLTAGLVDRGFPRSRGRTSEYRGGTFS